MKVNGSFPGIPSDKSIGKKIAKAAILTGAVVGGAALCSRGKKNSALQKLANVLTDSILTPLKQKGIPFNEKIANIGENLKQAVSTFTSKRNGYSDVLDIVPARGSATQRPLLLPPGKAAETFDTELEASLKGLLHRGDNQLIFDIPIVSDAGAIRQTGKLPALPAPKNIPALPEKTGDDISNVAASRHFKNSITTPDVIELPGKIAEVVTDAGSVVEEAAKTTGEKFADAAFAGIGAGVLLTGGAEAIKATVNRKDDEAADLEDAQGEIEDTAALTQLGDDDAAAPVEASEEIQQPKQDTIKHDRVQVVTLNGKEFAGIFEDGIAYDEECEPLTGKLVADFESGKAVVLQYQDGVLQKSLIFKHKEDEAPKEIKTYQNGKIHQKFEDITLKNGTFVAKTTSTYRADDSMLQRIDVKTDDITRTKHFKNTTDETGKISGAPTPVLGTSVRHLSNGVERRKFYAYTADGKRRLSRIGLTMTDGTKHIQLVGNNKQPVGTIRLGLDKKIAHYVLGPNNNGDDGCLYFNDGKLFYAATESQFIDGELLAEYLDYQYSDTKITPLRPLKEGEKDYEVPHETTTVYKADSGSTVAITRFENSMFVKKVEYFENEDDEVPASSVTYSRRDKVTAEYSSHESSVSDQIKTKLVVKQGEDRAMFPQIEKLESSDETMDVYRRKDGSVVKIEKDEQGYATSIAGYANEEAQYPEFITTFDHGTPLKDTVYDAEGNVVFNAKYNVVPAVIKQEAEKPEPEVIAKPEAVRNLDGHVSFNDTYNIKTFYSDIWEGSWFNSKPVKEIKRDENDVYEISLLNPYKDGAAAYKILLDENRTIQRLEVYSAEGDSAELFMDEEGHLEIDSLRYALNNGDLVKVGPFKKDNLERYRAKDGGVIEFVKNENGTVASIGYYEDETSEIPVCRTFLKNGAPTRDVVYDREDGETAHISDYEEDMENVENPLEDVHYFGSANPLSLKMFTRDGKGYGLTQKERELYYGHKD